MIEVRDLSKTFETDDGKVEALQHITLSIEAGDIYGIIGMSGAGKSTLVRCLNFLERPTSGTVEIEGKDLGAMTEAQLRATRREISMIFQDPMTSLDPVFKVGRQMVEMIMAHQSVTKEEARKMALEALDKVGIPEPEKRMNAYPYELSGGMCQRVIIAMAVCCKPKLIIADEPTTALDVTVQAQVLELLKDLQKTMDTAILLITHNLGVVWDMCDKVMVMYAGNTVEFTDTKTLYSNPKHPYTWGLLNSMPKLSDASHGELQAIPGTPPDLRLTGKCCNFYNRCPYVTDACMASVPPLVEIEPGHLVACHRQNLEHSLEKGMVTKDEE